MTEKHEFIRWLRKRGACGGGVSRAKKHATPQSAWDDCCFSDVMKWLLYECAVDEWLRHAAGGQEPLGQLVCWCASPVELRKRFRHIPWKRGMK